MLDASTSQALVPVGIIFVSALGVLVAAAGLIYWAIHNLGRDLREEIRLHREETRQENELLRNEMREGFVRLENIIMRHQHDDDGFPIVRFRPSNNG